MGSDLPAILGGWPISDKPLNIVRPLLPPLEFIYDRLNEAMQTGQLTNNGRYTQQFETELAQYFQVKHAIAVGNATIGLIILLKALCETGEVILPSFSYAASAHAVKWAGLRPVFADILPDTYTLDPKDVAKRVTSQTVAIMGVHIYGQPCEIDELQRVADQHKLPLVFDSAHAFGSDYRERKIGGWGQAEVFSFHATKIFPTGEGGAICTDDGDLAGRIRQLRTFGISQGDETTIAGLNGKMQEFNALIGLENMKLFETHIQQRKTAVELIQSQLEGIDGLIWQAERPFTHTNYQNLSVQIDPTKFNLTRDQLHLALQAENIHTRKYFYPPLHQHPTYHDQQIQLPITEQTGSRILCLPLYSDMTANEAEQVAAAIKRIHKNATDIAAKEWYLNNFPI